MSDYSGIMVFSELNEDLSLKKVSFELLTKAREISDITGERVVCAVFRDSPELSDLASYGAEEVVVVKRSRKAFFDIEGDTAAAVELIRKYRPSKVLFGATDIGRILAPKIAAELHCGITADCTEFSINDNGRLVQIRPALGGNILAHIVSPDTYPQMATARPSVFRPVLKEVPFVKQEFVPEKKAVPEVTLLEMKKTDMKNDVKIEDALKIISVGMGVKQKILPKVMKFADLIGATVACSRKVVEAGWLPHSVQVGQSGKTITPELYIALGISGASQHLAGMKTSGEIIAVNSDPDADIFSVAHMGFVVDVEKWLDEMILKFEKGN